MFRRPVKIGSNTLGSDGLRQTGQLQVFHPKGIRVLQPIQRASPNICIGARQGGIRSTENHTGSTEAPKPPYPSCMKPCEDVVPKMDLKTRLRLSIGRGSFWGRQSHTISFLQELTQGTQNLAQKPKLYKCDGVLLVVGWLPPSL